MKALVVFDSKFGNTQVLAEAIGEELVRSGEVELVKAAGPIAAEGIDLLVIGGPTQAHGMSAGLREALKKLPKDGLRDVPAATFDTRFHMSRFLTGSAAQGAASRLRKAGCKLIAPPESFFVLRDTAPDGQQLEAGEVQRARQWALGLAEAVSHTSKTPVHA